MDDCSCGMGVIMDSRVANGGSSSSSSVWSPRSEGATNQADLLAGYSSRLMIAAAAAMATTSLPGARHSKSLDQLGPDLDQQQPPTRATNAASASAATAAAAGHQLQLQQQPHLSSKTLPRSASTQLISRIATAPASVPSRGKQRPLAPSCTSLFPACSAPDPCSLGSTPVATLPRAKSTQTLVPNSLQQQQPHPHSSSSITSLLAAMFPEIPRSGQLPGYRPPSPSLDFAELADSIIFDGSIEQILKTFINLVCILIRNDRSTASP